MAKKKKRKRVYKIMLDETKIFDVECLADYFFLEKDYEQAELDPNVDCYYRQSTCLVVYRHKRIKRVTVSKGKYKSILVTDETYEIQKLDVKRGYYFPVWETDSLDELAYVFQSFGEFESVSWWSGYEQCKSAFPLIFEEEE